MDKLDDYDYELPAELIAQEPLSQRDQSRLLVVDRHAGTLRHQRIRDLPAFLQPGDCLALNDTRVIPAKLRGFREKTGGKWEGLFLGVTEAGTWRFLGQTRGRLLAGESILLVPVASDDPLSAAQYRLHLLAQGAGGIWEAKPETSESVWEILDQFGGTPLPPYIERGQPRETDVARYQTVYARQPGAVAAPTAGLHFSPELFDACAAAGVMRAFLTLHVGIGTFRPISTPHLADHRMHSEWCAIPDESAETINRTRAAGHRIVAVGTTAVRTLESSVREGKVQSGTMDTDLFIRPPYAFQAVDCLLTNFHLPKSSLLVLVSAFAGYELTRKAYAEAIRERYRFFSYGDAMLIV